ncbi:hypothetical protein KCP70_00885 [Salmonella enterica subsp. enterica]|nr:hypothetical protein KCP70_00885 [Salmonella enterica subsp. enterica]
MPQQLLNLLNQRRCPPPAFADDLTRSLQAICISRGMITLSSSCCVKRVLKLAH